MFSCVLCKKEWCVTSSLCKECSTIIPLMEVYGKDTILSVLEKVLIIQRFKSNKDNLNNHRKKWAKIMADLEEQTRNHK